MPPKSNAEKENPPAARSPWLSKRTAALVMILLSAGVFALVWLSAPEGAAWRTTLKVAVVMTLAMWLIFAFVFTLNRWLRSR